MDEAKKHGSTMLGIEQVVQYIPFLKLATCLSTFAIILTIMYTDETSFTLPHSQLHRPPGYYTPIPPGSMLTCGLLGN
jgi:hypothetical protein